MSLVDSEAAFQKRCDELMDGLHDMFGHLQIATFSGLAFSVGTPQQQVAEDDVQRFAAMIVQGPASLAQVSVIKRIHFEAQTLLMADIRKQATVGDTSEPSKSLPSAEKRRRLEAQQARITGLSHVHEQRASHALIDLCFHIVESGALLYVAPSRCSSRDAEIQCEAKNKQKQLLTLEQGTLKSVSADALPMVDVGTEMKLMYAFQRRGLAFDLVGLLSWDAHTEWTNKLFRALMADVPAHFQPIGLQQIIKADQEMFILLSSEYEGPLKAPAIDGEPPLDAQIRMLMNDPRVNVFLVPMPSHHQKRPAASTHGPDRPVQPPIPRSQSQVEKLQRKSRLSWRVFTQRLATTSPCAGVTISKRAAPTRSRRAGVVLDTAPA